MKVGTTKNATSVVTVSAGGVKVVSASAAAGQQMSLKIPKPRLWTPDSPFLYDVKIELKTGQKTVDTVGSYAGMRSIAVKPVDGKQRIVLNGKFLFQSGTLDQGYWPDGIYTAPTDAALKSDLTLLKSTGFNMVRKHIKVEPQRWYYWADKLGLMVWQDMPSMRPDYQRRGGQSPVGERVQGADRPAPQLAVGGALGGPERGLGPARPGRGGRHGEEVRPEPAGRQHERGELLRRGRRWQRDVIDNHNYTGPGVARPTATRAGVVGEFGGLGLKVAGHEWFPGGGFSYEDQARRTG